MILSWVQITLDFLLFAIYLSVSLTIFTIYLRSEVSQVTELFPNLWIFSGLFFFFRALQKGFEVLSQFSVLNLEMSIMEILFKSVILVILVAILIIIRQNYSYFIQISHIMVEVNRRVSKEQLEQAQAQQEKIAKEAKEE